ncbi:MAG: MotA/TolQ/ExbB proton channel family protein [Planctomycetota bacterium]
MLSLVLALMLQQSSSPAVERTASLADVVARAKLELAEERARVRDEEATLVTNRDAAQAELDESADRYVELAGAIEQKTRTLHALDSERTALRASAAAARATFTAARELLRVAHAQLADLVAALPPGEAREDQRADLDRLARALAGEAAQPFDVAPFLHVTASLLAEGRSVAQFEHAVRNADGVVEPARMLRAGMICTAYRTLSSGRIGEVFAAPPPASGYRFSEALPDWARAVWQRAFEAAPAASAALELPIDVTQQLTPDRRQSQRTLLELLRAGGLTMIPLSMVAVVAVLVMLERAITLGVWAGSSERAIEAVLEHCRHGRVQQAAALSRRGRGTVLRALAAALREHTLGRAQMQEAVVEAVLQDTPKLERCLPLLAVLAGVSPMLGLLGTVTGMITTFDMIRLFGSGDPKVMAGGVSEALVATASGLVIAIPILLLHSWSSGRADRILADTERHATALIHALGTSAEVADARPVA